jgi:glycosyltransferase involved in cell wall biosynthesis
MSSDVSLIIPTYNRADLVVEAIESVLAQSHPPEQIIVVDDGSTDHTSQALSAYGERIEYLRQDNAGVNAARNRGLERARCTYVALLDSDDLWLPEKTAQQLAVLARFPDTAFVFSDFYIYRPPEQRRPRGLHTWHADGIDWDRVLPSSSSWDALNSSGPGQSDGESDGVTDAVIDGATTLRWGDVFHASLQAPYVLPSTTLFRREVARGLYFPEDVPTGGDWQFFAQLSRRAGTVYLDSETTLNRSHEDTVRLTRVDSRVRLRARIAMTRNVWRGDPDFAQTHGPEIDAVEGALLCRLALLEALEGEASTAREAISAHGRLRHAPKSVRTGLLGVALRVPGFVAALRAARGLKRGLRL